MLITFHCSHCNAKLRIDADAMGSPLNCPECETHITVPHQDFGPGFVVGGFAIKRKIGEGGMGEVYLARQLSMERDVALKILPPQYTRQGNFVVRFLKEVHYQAKLDHPNIVTAFEAGEDNGIYFMAMAYVQGKTLEEELEETGAIPEARSLDVVRQVALALRYAAEEKAILHRDIKPGNIIVTPAGVAKVLDMGLSKSVYDAHPHTHGDTLLGTPNYMSPEQIDTPQRIDTRSDMFSLGMTLFHMLTGQVPFADSSYMQTLKRHGSEKLEDPRHQMPGIGEGAVRLIWRLVARDPADRFENWDAFLRALQAAKAGRDEEIAPPAGASSLAYDPGLRPPAPPPRLATRAGKMRGRGILQSILAGLLLGFAGILLLSRLLPRGGGQAPPPLLPTPEPAPTPSPQPQATIPLATLREEFARIILEYEGQAAGHDEVIQRLRDLGTRGSGTDVAVQAAQQILRVRQDRDRDLQEARQRLREEVLHILRHDGPKAAHEYLSHTNHSLALDVSGELESLRERVREWERQELSQREQSLAAAKERLAALARETAPWVLQGNWETALSMVDQAAADSLLFAAADQLADLRAEILAARDVPAEILKGYRPNPAVETNLWLRSGVQTLRIREVQADALLVSKIARDEKGAPIGSAEQVIPFAQLSPHELMRKMIPLSLPHHDLYRGLLAQRSGNSDAAKYYYQLAGTALAQALAAQMPTAPELPSPR